MPAFQRVGARYYDPLFGRFITRDTDLSQSPYGYCNGDPVNCTDPSGHSAKEIGWGLIGAAAGLVLGLVLLIFFGPEVALGAGLVELYEALNAAIAANGIASVMVPGLVSLGGGAAGALMAEMSEASGEKTRPVKGIGWQGDNAPSQMYIPVKGGPGHYIQSGPATSSPPSGSQVLPAGTPYKSQ